jgi:DNA-binding winged helix-turn-helix (wHTH) protein
MIYYFAHCALDTQLHTLRRASQSILLPPKVFEVLCYLIAHRGRVISKQELCEQVWRGLTVSEATLESCIRMVRASVGDSGQAQQIIQTQRGYGYRFVATMQAPTEAPPRVGAETVSPAWLLPDTSVQEKTQTASVPSLSLRQPTKATKPLHPGGPPCGTSCSQKTRNWLDRRLYALHRPSFGWPAPCPTRILGSKYGQHK